MRVLLLLLTALLFIGCNSPERYSRNKQAGETWLSNYTGAAKINLTGGWKSEDWGTAAFVQGSNRINGQIDTYTVYGRASGEKAYLLISDDGWNYYSAVLSMPNQHTLQGYYSKSVPFNPKKQHPMLLERVR